ncbi:hypothetical protein [Micavibrio aeruginosavorus]|uniref:Uncharacterized protein n=1 Tax=Micavibrio aeruginosavorus EPB TaxID=349215 RepID=M4VVS1_9BACT|nr:hypothetical protein [Micavibrio aeruginosavorus]AGH97299.1 hypothetical protein A11S_472 [Micavibrio aeruginosavorus EPB]
MSFEAHIGDSLSDLGAFTAISSDGGAPSMATLGAMVNAGLDVSVDPSMGRGLSAQFGMAHGGLAMGAGGALHLAGTAPAPAPAQVAGPSAPTQANRQPTLGR